MYHYFKAANQVDRYIFGATKAKNLSQSNTRKWLSKSQYMMSNHIKVSNQT